MAAPKLDQPESGPRNGAYASDLVDSLFLATLPESRTNIDQVLMQLPLHALGHFRLLADKAPPRPCFGVSRPLHRLNQENTSGRCVLRLKGSQSCLVGEHIYN